ncbi:MAG: envC 2 [Firmicutes bacterium]|nr:envC 2 [Bacillota bacterium]
MRIIRKKNERIYCIIEERLGPNEGLAQCVLSKGVGMIMHGLNETNHKMKTAGNRILMIFNKWISSLLCFLLLFSIGIFANTHQTLSASGLAVTEVQTVRQNEAAQRQEMIKIARATDKLAVIPSIWPISGTVTSRFGWRNSPWGGGSEFHAGIDIANSSGTPVVAAADGKVVQSTWSEGYGNIVQIDHGNGMVTVYGHNSRNIVNAGQNVQKGQVISYVGSTGRSTGPHLHYEVRINDKAVDPIRFMVLY